MESTILLLVAMYCGLLIEGNVAQTSLIFGNLDSYEAH